MGLDIVLTEPLAAEGAEGHRQGGKYRQGHAPAGPVPAQDQQIQHQGHQDGTAHIGNGQEHHLRRRQGDTTADDVGGLTGQREVPGVEGFVPQGHLEGTDDVKHQRRDADQGHGQPDPPDQEVEGQNQNTGQHRRVLQGHFTHVGFREGPEGLEVLPSGGITGQGQSGGIDRHADGHQQMPEKFAQIRFHFRFHWQPPESAPGPLRWSAPGPGRGRLRSGIPGQKRYAHRRSR